MQLKHNVEYLFVDEDSDYIVEVSSSNTNGDSVPIRRIRRSQRGENLLLVAVAIKTHLEDNLDRYSIVDHSNFDVIRRDLFSHFQSPLWLAPCRGRGACVFR